ncbi:hypothetical protein ABG768_022157 [Culter alburnus]|uniref:Uncharacterized protein n=1 Tax=Culter alburnus TaxID=194366 RepID=A0AAW2AMG1_CULAL
MEVLSRRADHSGGLDEKELEKSKQEAHKSFVKEKIKFSAFLNEITRQVLSPSRLTSLGVTDVHRPSSPGQISTSSKALSPKPEHKREKKSKITRSRPGSSASSITSTAHSHVSKLSHSSKHSHSRTSSINNSIRLFPGVTTTVQEVIQAILALPQKVFLLGLNVATKVRRSTKLPPKSNISNHQIVEIHTTNLLYHITITMKIIIALLHVLVLQNQKTTIIIPIKNLITIIPIQNLITIIPIQNLITIIPIQNPITIIPIQNLITIMPTQNPITIITIIPIQNPITIMPIQNLITIIPIQNLITIMPIQNLITIIPIQNLITILLIQNFITIMTILNLITIMPIQNLITIIHHRHLITTMELIVTHHHTTILLHQIPIIIHPLHHITIMELTAAQHTLLSQGLTISFPIQKLILLTKNYTTINIHRHHHITTMEVTAPQNLPTIIPIQNLTTIILLLSTTMESMVVHLIFLLTQKLTTSLM